MSNAEENLTAKTGYKTVVITLNIDLLTSNVVT